MQEGSEYIIKQLDELYLAYCEGTLPIGNIIDNLQSILIRKGQDYSGTENQWYNFEFAKKMSNMQSLEQVIVVMCSIKFSRLNSLVFADKEPNFESIDDNLKDLVNYLILLLGYLEFKREKIQV